MHPKCDAGANHWSEGLIDMCFEIEGRCIDNAMDARSFLAQEEACSVACIRRWKRKTSKTFFRSMAFETLDTYQLSRHGVEHASYR